MRARKQKDGDVDERAQALLDKRQDACVRRAAGKVGLRVKKARASFNVFCNLGDYMLIDPSTNVVVAGASFDLTAQDVIDYCQQLADQAADLKCLTRA
jgi:hypothetical protein